MGNIQYLSLKVPLTPVVTRDKTVWGHTTFCLLPPSHLQPCVHSTVTTHLLELPRNGPNESHIHEFTEFYSCPIRVRTKYKCLSEGRVGAELTHLPGSSKHWQMLSWQRYGGWLAAWWQQGRMRCQKLKLYSEIDMGFQSLSSKLIIFAS